MTSNSMRGSCASVALALVALSACSSSSSNGDASGSTSISGTIGGTKIATTDTTAVVGSLTVMNGTTTGTAYEAVVLITNQSNACTIAQGSANPANGTALTIVVGAASPVVAGTYPIGT